MVTWPYAAGLNCFGPAGSPVYSVSGNPGTYPADPYTPSQYGAWRSHVTSAIMARDLSVGVDHYRHQPSPAPFLDAQRAGDATRLAGYHAAMDQIVDDTLGGGLGVAWTPFLSQPNIDPLYPLDGIGSPGFENFSTYLISSAVRYAPRGPKFALGLMNEPPDPSTFSASWPVMQKELFRRVRAAVGGAMTLFVTAANYSSPYLLSGSDYSFNVTPANGLNPGDYDGNCLFEFHPLYPSPLVLQGANYNGRYKYVRGMAYPPDTNDKAAVVVATSAAINTDGSLTTAQKTALLASATGSGGLIEEIGYYYSLPQNGAWFGKVLDSALTWARYYGLAPSRLYAGEIGITRQNTAFGAGIGNDELSRSRYMRDASIEVSKRGIRSAWDHLDTPDYGVTKGAGTVIGDYAPAHLAALNFPGLKLLRY